MKYHSDPYDPLQMITALYIDCFVMLCKQVAWPTQKHYIDCQGLCFTRHYLRPSVTLV